MKIHSNSSAIIANNALSVNEGRLSVSIEKLSSGFKINHAKDNPAGLAIAKKMNAQIRCLERSSDSADNGVSVVETAEGALAEVQDILQRMNELAVKGSNGTMTDNDRGAIQDEIAQLGDEITRIAGDTEFNGGSLLDGTYDYKGYSENNANVKVEYYSDETMTGKYSITGLNLTWDADGNLNPVDAADITLETAGTDGVRSFPGDCAFTVNQDTLTIKSESGFEMRLQFEAGYAGLTAADEAISLDITGKGGMKIQLGANEGQELDIRIPTISLKTLDINQVDYSTQNGCKEAMDKMNNAISYVSATRSRLGAYQNRLEHAAASLDVTVENMTAAYSRIMDVNMATEMTEYTKGQVLTQAGTSMLAQANERPSQVLQLLQ